MIRAESDQPNYLTRWTDGVHTASADTTPDKGGSKLGFRPHDLLEAALATCTNITLRMAAEKHALPLQRADVQVTLDRSKPETAVFTYRIVLHGPLTEAQRAQLLRAAERCPVRQTLSRQIGFVHTTPETGDRPTGSGSDSAPLAPQD